MSRPSFYAPRWLLSVLVLGLWLISCTPGFDAVSKINTLRILAVEVDKPYAVPGDTVRFSLTAVDALGDSPRGMQVVWIGGCFNPQGDQYFLCFEQLAEQLQSIMGGGGTPPSSEFFKGDFISSEQSGVPRASTFDLVIPDDIVTSRPRPDTGPYYGISYVFFAACAGTLRPTELQSLGGEVPEFPLECIDDNGQKLGSDSFVIGYTQVYAFEDGRLNASPPIDGLTLDGAAMPDGQGDDIVTVPSCPATSEARRTAGCGEDPVADCTKFTLNAIIADVAEDDPGAFGGDGQQLRETIWVTYFSDGGDLAPAIKLVSDATLGYRPDFTTEWTPPDEPGVYSIWAVVRDQRGGSDIVQRFVRVE